MKVFIIKSKTDELGIENNKNFSIIVQDNGAHIEMNISVSIITTTDIEEVWGREVIREEQMLVPKIEVVDASDYVRHNDVLLLWVRKNINEIFDFVAYNQDKKEIDGLYCRLGKKLY